MCEMSRKPGSDGAVEEEIVSRIHFNTTESKARRGFYGIIAPHPLSCRRFGAPFFLVVRVLVRDLQHLEEELEELERPDRENCRFLE